VVIGVGDDPALVALVGWHGDVSWACCWAMPRTRDWCWGRQSESRSGAVEWHGGSPSDGCWRTGCPMGCDAPLACGGGAVMGMGPAGRDVAGRRHD